MGTRCHPTWRTVCALEALLTGSTRAQPTDSTPSCDGQMEARFRDPPASERDGSAAERAHDVVAGDPPGVAVLTEHAPHSQAIGVAASTFFDRVGHSGLRVVD